MATIKYSVNVTSNLIDYTRFQFLFSFRCVRRAATIEAETDGQLWAMDRQTFRRIILKTANKKRQMYMKMIDCVPMLKTLQVSKHRGGSPLDGESCLGIGHKVIT